MMLIILNIKKCVDMLKDELNCVDFLRLSLSKMDVVDVTNKPHVNNRHSPYVLWTGYKQAENYKTRQVLLIHQLVLIC
jgi:hypothetical protein